MRALTVWIAALATLAACHGQPAHPEPPTRPRGNEQPALPGTQVGMASWYGRELQGRRTASGERFDRRGMTAAHRTLKFGTRVRVTRLKNNRSVVVRINDRGPFSKGRIIDVSEAAARSLDMIDAGVTKVRIEVVTE